MGIKRESDKPNKKDFIIGLFLVLLCLTVLALSLYGIKNYNTERCEWISMTYLSRVESLDNLASCYKGCQYTTQPYWNNAVDDKEFRIKQYDKCTKLCEERYG